MWQAAQARKKADGGARGAMRQKTMRVVLEI
jgi:hypothetical protein